MRATFLAALLLLAAGFAGCLGNEEPAPEPAAPAASGTDGGLGNVSVDDGTEPMPDDLGHQPHIHDYWKGKERVTLMDEEIPADAFRTLAFTFFDVFRGTPGVGGAIVDLPDGAIVYEGTGQLELTVSWSDPLVTGMGMAYRSAVSPDFGEFVDVQNGQAVVVDVAPEMTDMPHAQTSRWRFLLAPDTEGEAVAGAVHVKVDIVKTRDLEAFPGHPRLFGEANTLVLFSGPGKSSQSNFVMTIAGFLTGSQADSSIVSEKVVPMETLAMTANLTVTSASASVGSVSGIYFYYSPADTNRWTRADPVEVDEEGGFYRFAWPVDMQQTDSPYAQASAWEFMVRASSDPTGTGDSQCGSCSDVQIEFELEVVAYDRDVTRGG